MGPTCLYQSLRVPFITVTVRFRDMQPAEHGWAL
jgi:hypothetical protein